MLLTHRSHPARSRLWWAQAGPGSSGVCQMPSAPCPSPLPIPAMLQHTASISQRLLQSQTHPQCHILIRWLTSASANAWLWILTLVNSRTIGHPSTHKNYLIKGQCFWGACQDKHWLVWDRDNSISGWKLLEFRDISENITLERAAFFLNFNFSPNDIYLNCHWRQKAGAMFKGFISVNIWRAINTEPYS